MRKTLAAAGERQRLARTERSRRAPPRGERRGIPTSRLASLEQPRAHHPLGARMPSSSSPAAAASGVVDLSVEREDEVNSAVRGNGFGGRILVEEDLIGHRAEQRAVRGEIAAVLPEKDVHALAVA